MVNRLHAYNSEIVRIITQQNTIMAYSQLNRFQGSILLNYVITVKRYT